MNKLIVNEKGYSLLLTLMLVLLFSILGASLMAMTFNGAQKNVTREHIVQSEDLATKGIERIEKEVSAKLKIFPASYTNGMTNSQFESHFNNVILGFRCSTGKEITLADETGDGKFRTCIDQVKEISDGSGSKTRKELVFKSTGYKGKQESTVYETLEMGADDIQKVLNYTVSTLKRGEDGGNLLLNGGSEITGDMNIAGNIFSTNNGHGDGGWLQSVLPRSLKTMDSENNLVNSKLNLGGKAYNFKDYFDRTYAQHITGDFSNRNYDELSRENTKNIFATNYAPSIQYESEKIKPVNFTEEFNIDRSSYSRISASIAYTSDQNIKSSTSYNENLTIRGNNTDIKFDKNIYVNKNFTIGNSSNTTFENVSIDGKRIYVNGDVNINKVNLQANFTMFVKGKVSIQYVTVSGIKENTSTNPRGSLIVFADGNFILSNLSEFQDTPSTVNGFFYSTGTMEMYGFGSNTKIIGGVAANNIVLNAMRGKSKANLSEWEKTAQTGTKEECRFGFRSPGNEWRYESFLYWCRDVPDITTIVKPYQKINNHYYETRENQENAASRLQIIYDHELLDTFRNTIDYTSSVIMPQNIIDPIKKGRSLGPD
ncbi:MULTISPECIES: hypothetical protein [Planococcus]|uniref:Type 4 fimbrial biogenesis protein PilX N-terminal domain-containing protein n=1 Tax=Planococcus wigleyi TaxID=2762216 RepID=A0ABR8WFP0_9BACL|nr:MULTISPECIES: hypothetical protein [Planococcus]MBD8015828.1 hypothetical protein [Planococcus wigleyi]MDN3438202.1 hypothetical protein [Planococcus sp. APC 3900]